MDMIGCCHNFKGEAFTEILSAAVLRSLATERVHSDVVSLIEPRISSKTKYCLVINTVSPPSDCASHQLQKRSIKSCFVHLRICKF
jgi:hypothetical protein